MSEVQAAQDTTKAAGSSQDQSVAAAPVAPAAQEPTKVEASAPDAKVEAKADSSGNEPAKQEQKAESKDAQGAPEKYDLKLPEKSALDASAIERIAAYAKEQGLTNEEAQGLLEIESEAVSRYAQAQAEQVKSKVEGWKADVRKDKEIGGEAFEKNVELAKRVVERFASEDFKKALNETGLGNHPELVRVFFKIGLAMADDSLVQSGAQIGPKSRDVADLLYGNKQQ